MPSADFLQGNAMQESLDPVSDVSQSFKSIFQAVSISIDPDNSDHRIVLQCLSFLAGEEDEEKAVAVIPSDIQKLVARAVYKIKLEYSDFSLKLTEEWLLNLPSFMNHYEPEPEAAAVVAKTPVATPPHPPVAKPVTISAPNRIPKESEPMRLPQPPTPRDLVVSPGRHSGAPIHAQKRDHRRGSLPDKKKGFFGRLMHGRVLEEEKTDEHSQTQSQSF